MIKIIYEADPEGGKLTMRAEGHAGYAPAGQDIVCAAVSCLMQTLAYSAAEDEKTSSCIYQGKEGPVVNVEAGDSVLMRDKFELVADGLALLAVPGECELQEKLQVQPGGGLAAVGAAAGRMQAERSRRREPQPGGAFRFAAVCGRRRRCSGCWRRWCRPCGGRKGGVCSCPGQGPGGCCR